MECKNVVKVPDILIPEKNINIEKWSVVACDQYTSEPDYWEEVEEIVGDEPSALKIIFPEVFLEEDDKNERIKDINKTMDTYINKEILKSVGECFVYLERKFKTGQIRKGLMLSIDLEDYDYNKGSQSLIRATEGTVLDRLPPRIKVRENASLEIPHIMLLIDDPQKNIIESFSNSKNMLDKIYDFKLMKDGGELKGYKVSNQKHINYVLEEIQKLCDIDIFSKKYDLSKDISPLLFAVGDGNHSLATAKACWNNLKKQLTKKEALTHPARYALVEVVNLHDNSLIFEPIHRVVFNIDYDDFFGEMNKFFKQIEVIEQDELILSDKELCSKENEHIIPYFSSDKKGIIKIINPQNNLEVGTLQSFLDYFIEKYGNKIDYIHGKDVLMSLSIKDNNIGFYLPAMDKNDLFKTVILDGSLPRKTFSMGEAQEKRFYLECKKIK